MTPNAVIGTAGAAVITLSVGALLFADGIRPRPPAPELNTIEEMGQLTLAELLGNAPDENRAIIASASRTPAFAPCEKEGMAGVTARRSCVTPASQGITLSGNEFGLFEKIAFQDLRSVEVRGGAAADLSPLGAYPDLKRLVLIDV